MFLYMVVHISCGVFVCVCVLFFVFHDILLVLVLCIDDINMNGWVLMEIRFGPDYLYCVLPL